MLCIVGIHHKRVKLENNPIVFQELVAGSRIDRLIILNDSCSNEFINVFPPLGFRTFGPSNVWFSAPSVLGFRTFAYMKLVGAQMRIPGKGS